jgi:dTDP-4-amino-4,6-dideoxygalactose transaminase
MENLGRWGIGTQVHYIPVYKHLYYKKQFNYEPSNYPAAEKYYDMALTLPLYPSITKRSLNYVIGKVLSLSV